MGSSGVQSMSRYDYLVLSYRIWVEHVKVISRNALNLYNIMCDYIPPWIKLYMYQNDCPSKILKNNHLMCYNHSTKLQFMRKSVYEFTLIGAYSSLWAAHSRMCTWWQKRVLVPQHGSLKKKTLFKSNNSATKKYKTSFSLKFVITWFEFKIP